MNISDILTSAIYSNSVATIAMIVALVAVPASGYLSYKFAIKGERRKEWNSIAEPLLSHYEQVASESAKNQTYSTTSMPLDEFGKIQRRMSIQVRGEFMALTEKIIILRNSPPTAQRNAELNAAASRMCKIIKLR